MCRRGGERITKRGQVRVGALPAAPKPVVHALDP
jgi:hypothetical protein